MLLVVAFLASACADSGSAEQSTQAETTTSATPTTSKITTAEPSATVAAVEPEPAAVPVRMQLEWLVTMLNDGGTLTNADAEAHFSPQFLSQVPVEQLVGLIPQLFALAEPPYSVDEFEAFENGTATESQLRGASGGLLSVQMGVDAVAPHLIEGLLITPAVQAIPEDVTVDSIDAALAEIGELSSVGVYNVSGDECEAVHEVRTDSSIVLGSVFKLWVLAALASEIDAGRATWDETLTVTDELRSTPGGQIYPMDTGTEVSIEDLARVMIAISDNTATDMLLDRLGRETVEAAMVRSGVGDPAANVPMMSTGNLFALKFVPDEPNASDYRALDEVGRRALLDELDERLLPWVVSGASLEELAATPNADGVPINKPRDLDIEWFATPEDLCRTMLHLGELAETPGLELVATILEESSGGGLPFDGDRWPTIRFKGGSEPGVLAGVWWFEGSDGDRYVVAGGVTDSENALNETDAITTLAAAIQLVG
ncbi:MAG: serine hydrolase [Acidimicrobiales bacterium]